MLQRDHPSSGPQSLPVRSSRSSSAPAAGWPRSTPPTVRARRRTCVSPRRQHVVQFAKVVEAKGFSEAGRRVKIPISTVNGRLAELEVGVGRARP
jgi:hypothetical protein